MELMVVLAIIIVITTVVLTSQSSFNKTLLLANTAYDIALTLRFTESLGISSLAVGSIANAGRGAHFNKATKGSYVTFADTQPDAASCGTTPNCKPGDYIYTSGQDTLVQTYTLGNGMKITDFCAHAGNDMSTGWLCASGTLTTLDIVFARPNLDAFIRAGISPSVISDPLISYNSACLKVTSLNGGFRFIKVMPSGAITANAVSDPASCHE
jgi:type II secretory pathway pseudopilin PulG